MERKHSKKIVKGARILKPVFNSLRSFSLKLLRRIRRKVKYGVKKDYEKW
jgi:hypothetical protein